jgi:NADH-quinone oxidoreductase subunit J
MTLYAAIFAAFIAVGFAAVMLFSRSPYVSAVCLLIVLLQTGIIFILRGAALLGLLQIMVYAGAVMVLVVITIMATGGEPESGMKRFTDFTFPRWLAVLGLLAVLLEIALVAFLLGDQLAIAPPSSPLPAGAFGPTLFKSYALATEAVTLMMFLAAIAILPDRDSA